MPATKVLQTNIQNMSTNFRSHTRDFVLVAYINTDFRGLRAPVLYSAPVILSRMVITWNKTLADISPIALSKCTRQVSDHIYKVRGDNKMCSN